jgi:hypothetical protein
LTQVPLPGVSANADADNAMPAIAMPALNSFEDFIISVSLLLVIKIFFRYPM